MRASVELQTEWGTEPRIILSNKSPYRVSYSVLQADKKRTRMHHQQVIGSMGLLLNASSAGAVGGSADFNRTSNVTVETEETERYLMFDHRMEPMGQTQDTKVFFPVGCQELRVYAFFEEDGQWQFYKNKLYSIAPRNRNFQLTALRSNILPYTTARNTSI